MGRSKMEKVGRVETLERRSGILAEWKSGMSARVFGVWRKASFEIKCHNSDDLYDL